MATIADKPDPFQELKGIVKKLVDEQNPVHTLMPEVQALSELFLRLGAYQKKPNITDQEIFTGHGLAVSPTMAAMCVDDYVRTVVFMRGLYAAIQSLQKTTTPVQILYIGCGPYATLALPLMSVLSSDQVLFTLLDIHQQSIQSVQSLAEKLDLADRIRAFEVIDASDYQVAASHPPDIVLMEIMQAGLMKEPQVAISRHIMTQVPQALLLPQNIRVDLVAIDAEKEFSLQTDASGQLSYDRYRQPIGCIFELSHKTIQAWPPSARSRLPAACLQVPVDLAESHELRLFTHIQVYAEYCLDAYDSGLTCPLGLPTSQRIQTGDQLQFEYCLGNEPGLRVKAAKQA